MPGTVPDVSRALTSNVRDRAPGADRSVRRRAARLRPAGLLFTQGVGYAVEMGRTQTLYGLANWPIGLAAWMLGHDAYSLEDIALALQGRARRSLTGDEVLDNITMTGSRTRASWSGPAHTGRTRSASSDIKDVRVLAAVSVSRQLDQALRSWTEQADP